MCRGFRSILYTNTSSGFAGIITAVAAYSIWGGEMFPAEKDQVVVSRECFQKSCPTTSKMIG